MQTIHVLGAVGLLFLAATIFADEPPKVEVGKSAPEIDLPAANIGKALPDKKDAKSLNLSDFQKGANAKNVVLFFFPKAFTGG